MQYTVLECSSDRKMKMKFSKMLCMTWCAMVNHFADCIFWNELKAIRFVMNSSISSSQSRKQ